MNVNANVNFSVKAVFSRVVGWLDVLLAKLVSEWLNGKTCMLCNDNDNVVSVVVVVVVVVALQEKEQ